MSSHADGGGALELQLCANKSVLAEGGMEEGRCFCG